MIKEEIKEALEKELLKLPIFYPAQQKTYLKLFESIAQAIGSVLENYKIEKK